MERPASPRQQRNRVRVAQAAARLIAEHGLTDWALAKRKACRELGLTDRENMPDNVEVEQALRDYNSLFLPSEQPARLKEQRAEALRWMERLASWNPVLIGAVAEGWATEYSEIRLELEAEDAKAVELSLINAGIEYASAPVVRGREAQVQLSVEGSRARMRLVIVSPRDRRNRPRQPRSSDERLNIAQLRNLLDGDAAS